MKFSFMGLDTYKFFSFSYLALETTFYIILFIDDFIVWIKNRIKKQNLFLNRKRMWVLLKTSASFAIDPSLWLLGPQKLLPYFKACFFTIFG